MLLRDGVGVETTLAQIGDEGSFARRTWPDDCYARPLAARLGGRSPRPGRWSIVTASAGIVTHRHSNPYLDSFPISTDVRAL
jgi:hypothetical protein